MNSQRPQPTRVVNVRHKEPFDIYIGRHMPSRPDLRATGWGNPFKFQPGASPDEVAQAITSYRMWLADQPRLLARLSELRGKTLGCWCAPLGGLTGDLNGRICHGEVLAALADGLSDVEDAGEETWPPADRVCPCCGAVMVDADEAWWCDGCARWVCWRCKTAILPPLNAPAPRIRIECDTCRQLAATTAKE